MDILWLIADFALGFYLGITAMRAWQRYNLIATLKELGFDIDMIQDATDRLNSQLADVDDMIELPITLEQHSGQLYAYRKDTSEFLAQAPDIEQLKAAIGQKLNHSVRLVIAEGDGADLVQ
jgi:DNA-binding transcriptional MerR regulator